VICILTCSLMTWCGACANMRNETGIQSIRVQGRACKQVSRVQREIKMN